MELLKHLQTRQAEGNPIRTGLVGCGQEGSGMVHITHKMPGLITAAIADIDVNRPLNTLAALGIPRAAICVTNEPGPAQDALAEGHYVVTEDALLLAQLESIDAVVEATGVTDVGAQVAWHSIMAGQHVVMLNVETDVTVGLMLSHLAQKVGCVYTASTGDEPGVCKQLYDFAVRLGFEMVCLGKGKNNPIDFYATPETCRAEAERKNMNPKMLSAFKDGTKTMVELAAMANATGLVPDVPGAHGQAVDVPDLNKVLVPADRRRHPDSPGLRRIFDGQGGAGRLRHRHDRRRQRTREDMAFYSMGDGPYYTLYRPFHLCSIETPQAVAEAVIYGESVLVPQAMRPNWSRLPSAISRWATSVDGIGGFDFFSRIYTTEEAQAHRGIPMGLTPGGTVTQDIAQGEMLTEANFAPDTSTLVYQLRQLQNAL